VTPEDYTPRGFYQLQNSELIFPREMINLKLGEVCTPYHNLKLNARIEKTKLENLEDGKNTSCNTQNLQIKDHEMKTLKRNTSKLHVCVFIY
jgi:hypothetical protein